MLIGIYEIKGIGRSGAGKRVRLVCGEGQRRRLTTEPEGSEDKGFAMKGDRFFKCLANETRLRCLLLLVVRDELCVCDMAESLGASQPMISRHLAQLRACELVIDRREGQWVYYRLHPGLERWQLEVLAAAREGLGAEAPCGEDLARLEAIERHQQGNRCS